MLRWSKPSCSGIFPELDRRHPNRPAPAPKDAAER
jgi:hypothetical protein